MLLKDRPETIPGMARKKPEKKTVMVRLFQDFAEKVRQASGERGMSAAEFCEKFLSPCLEKAHRDYIKAEARRLGGEDA
jgi:hypothetical protein